MAEDPESAQNISEAGMPSANRLQRNAATSRRKKMVRLASLDAFRGFIMTMLAANGFGILAFSRIPEDAPVWQQHDYRWWQRFAWHFEHTTWESVSGYAGVPFWDLIQPAFMFMVGMSMPFSYGRRAAFGQSTLHRMVHALTRSIVLVLMGVFLYSMGHERTNWIFPNVLAQIGLGYFFAWMLLNRRFVTQVVALTVILVGYWGWFFLNPPPEGHDFASLNASADRGEVFTGSYAAWSKNGNAAFFLDQWLLPLLRTPADSHAAPSPEPVSPSAHANGAAPRVSSSETLPTRAGLFSIPSESEPSESESVPVESVPVESVPVESVPVESVPVDAVPTDAVPTDAVPTDAVPTDAVPTDAVPTDAVPTDDDRVADPAPEFLADSPAISLPAGDEPVNGGSADPGAAAQPESAAEIPETGSPGDADGVVPGSAMPPDSAMPATPADAATTADAAKTVTGGDDASAVGVITRLLRQWFLSNREPYQFNEGGYTTWNFIPSVGTMLLGIMCGQLILNGRSKPKILGMLLAGAVVCLLLGVLAHATVCPIVKRIWTPSWVLFSGGFVIGIVAVFYLLFDVLPLRILAFPLVVVGMNSLLAYLLGQTVRGWTASQVVRTHFSGILEWAGGSRLLDPQWYGAVTESTATFVLFWLLLLWLYRQRMFLRI